MDNQEYNARIIDEYLDYKKGVPQNTYKGIVADCKSITKYLSDNDVPITFLIETDFSERFIRFLTEKYTPATVKRRLCTLRSIIYWCKVSELQKLRIQDVSGSIIDDKMKMVCCTKSKCIDMFL
ncbi:MAG: hypothetical protein NC485_13005 [Ruminococcus flavefaciens]|nr:hypothetical protein [Ruminococcus flavefaciens]